MTLQLTPRITVTQQIITDDASIDMSSVNGITHIKGYRPKLTDPDPELVSDAEFEAEGKAALAFTERQQAIAEGKFNFDHMTASEQKQSIERAFTPLLRKLTKEHAEACEKVSDFEDSAVSFQANLCATFAYEGRHPEVKKIMCAGDTHFQSMLRTGQLDIPGYKMVDKRSMGVLSHQLVFIPAHVTSLLDYAQSPEAIALAQNEYDISHQKLVRQRKAAALKLTEAKQAARNALSQIVSFDELINDSVKRATRK